MGKLTRDQVVPIISAKGFSLDLRNQGLHPEWSISVAKGSVQSRVAQKCLHDAGNTSDRYTNSKFCPAPRLLNLDRRSVLSLAKWCDVIDVPRP